MAKLIKPVIFLLILVSNIITYQNKYDSLMNEFRNTALAKEAILNRHMDLISGYADIISVFGNSHFPGTGDSEYLSLLEYDAELDYYHMDAIEGTKLEKSLGNITGKGPVPDTGILRNELNLALHFNDIFDKLYHKLPDILSLKYVSENNFVNRYPFISSDEFKYTDDLKKQVFYRKAAPEYDSSRQPVWTPVYSKRPGAELIVTYSIPIYFKNEFMGVVSIDFTNLRFSELIDSGYESYLIDEYDTVLASGHRKIPGNQVVTLDKLLNISEKTLNAMKYIKKNDVKRIDGCYVYSIPLGNAPWKLFITVPAWTVISRSLITTLPIMLICLFLLMALSELEKRRKTERLLKDTIIELKAYQKLLESAAKMDFLTTTYNRRGFKEKLTENVEKGRTDRTPISLIIGDIDCFKQYNDTYGHASGDKVLIMAADIMKKNVNRNDIVCRWGGEEFLIMLLDKTLEEAFETAEKIRREVETTAVRLEDSMELNITITMGVAEYKEEESFDECVSRADRALYEGKEFGRNRVVVSRELSNT